MTLSQDKYFNTLRFWLGDIWDEFIQSNEEPHDFANSYCHWKFNQTSDTDYIERINILQKLISVYWNENSIETINYVRRSGENKANYFGDISPLPENHILNKALSISDFVLVPCGVEKVLKFTNHYDKRSVFFLLVKHALQMLNIEAYTNIDIKNPYVVVVPNIIYHDESYSQIMFESSIKVSIDTFNTLYDSSFTTFEEVQKFSKKFPSARDLAKEAKRNIINWEPEIENGSLEAYYDRYIEEVGIHSNNPSDNEIFQLILGKRSQSADALFITNFWGSSPLTDNQASYLSLVDYLKYSSPSNKDPQFVDQIFQKTDIPFLDFTNSNCLELREKRLIKKFRKAISEEIVGLNNQDLYSFERAVHKVENKLKLEFDEHLRSLNLVNKTYNAQSIFNLLGIVSFGALTITCSMWPAFLKLAGISTIFGTSNVLKSIKDSYDYREKLKEVKRGYIAILCK